MPNCRDDLALEVVQVLIRECVGGITAPGYSYMERIVVAAAAFKCVDEFVAGGQNSGCSHVFHHELTTSRRPVRK
jgi:hypothetical protein